jgi:hypothetical protein
MGNSDIGRSAASEPRRAKSTSPSDSTVNMGWTSPNRAKASSSLLPVRTVDISEASLRDGPSRTLEGDVIDATVSEFQMDGELVAT